MSSNKGRSLWAFFGGFVIALATNLCAPFLLGMLIWAESSAGMAMGGDGVIRGTPFLTAVDGGIYLTCVYLMLSRLITQGAPAEEDEYITFAWGFAGGWLPNILACLFVFGLLVTGGLQDPTMLVLGVGAALDLAIPYWLIAKGYERFKLPSRRHE